MKRMKDWLADANENGYAIGAFNVENMEMVLAVAHAAQKTYSPVIIQTTPGTLKYASAKMFRAMVKAAIYDADIPVFLHLDHGNTANIAMEAAEEKYDSVMIDGSKLSLEENITLTKQIKEYAIAFDIPVEGELGTIGGKEDETQHKDSLLTSVEDAKNFVDCTGVDLLAVSIGTSHGFYMQEPELDIERLNEIKRVVKIPIVLHGTSGVPQEQVRESIEHGICKVNYATVLRDVYTKEVRQELEHDDKLYDPKVFGRAAMEAVEEKVIELIKICGSGGRVRK